MIISDASFVLQKKTEVQTAALTKQDNRLQFFLAIFAGISATGTLIQTLAAAHLFDSG